MKFRQLRTSFVFKVISIYLTMMLLIPQSVIYTSYALTSGPSQPEFSSFTPIGTSDMVSLTSGDFTYNIPLMDIGGYPINIAYNSGITTDQEASWVGLGWNLSTGQINRSVRGIPDDFDGDPMIYENSLRDNWTVGVNVNVAPSIFGFGEDKDGKEIKKKIGNASFGLSVQYNSYAGISLHPSAGMSFDLAKGNSIGFNASSSTAEGVCVGANYSLSSKIGKKGSNTIGGSLGFNYNSRQGLGLNLGLNGSINKDNKNSKLKFGGNPSLSASCSFNDFRLFTPTKRVGMHSENISFNAALGGTITGIDGTLKVGGFYSNQSVKPSEKYKTLSAYGYENNENGLNKSDAVLDFNREKDRAYSKYTKMLGSTNFTYDIYSVSGQGIGGSFRPHKGQVTYVRDATVTDEGFGVSEGIEIEVGNAVSNGVDIKVSPSDSQSGLWKDDNDALENLAEDDTTPEFYEKNYYRMMDEINVDPDLDLFYGGLRGTEPLRFNIGGSKYERSVANAYTAYKFAGREIDHNEVTLNKKLTRTKRLLRNMVVQKVNKKDASQDPLVEVSNFAKKNHTVGYKLLKPDGNTYVFGKALYNTTKKEVSFAVDGDVDQQTGLISYTSDTSHPDNSTDNESGVDWYYNSITTPAYAHTYLLSTILSSDYEDSDKIAGPSDGDIGSYTKFIYEPVYQYKWRTPFQENKASGNPGYHSHPEDQKGSYVYGEREQTYISKIETKTHIAVFYTSARDDAFGVKDENGGRDTSSDTSPSKKLDKIELYAKEDYRNNPDEAIPIKVVHFDYDYSLTKKIPNAKNNSGKLTLKSIWFTYANSKMGKYTPYTFAYGKYKNADPVNPNYGLKDHDIWGNYKENNTSSDWQASGSQVSTIDFPYVEQNKQKADRFARAWTLTNIGLPSGGSIEVDYESDDYQYVQNRRAMQLFKVKKVSTGTGQNDIAGSALFGGPLLPFEAKYIHIDISDFLNNSGMTDPDAIINALLRGIKDQPIFFKFLLNMGGSSSDQYDYVSGYFFIDSNAGISVNTTDKELIIPMKLVNKQGGIFTSDMQVNPISKAGWYFGRNNMPRIVYSYTHDPDAKNWTSILAELASSITSLTEFVSGPNGKLRENGTAQRFIANKSWVRLLEPTRSKLGGGSRVAEIRLNNAWESMIADKIGSANPDLYSKSYGQTYTYKDKNGYSSGVATFEPSMSKENPFVEPFYNDKGSGGIERILAPKDQNYFEMPIGESFFPSPAVTYSRVVVQSLTDPQSQYSKHGTGWIENEFYTTKDFPTETHSTPIDKYNDDNKWSLWNLLNLKAKNYLTLSQGFSIVKNDMNGKQKSQEVYDQNGNLISGVKNIYSLENGKLNNFLPVIDEKGNISKKIIGVETDVVNDFKQNISHSRTYGVDINTQAFFIVIPIVIPVPIPDYSSHTNALYMATSTKVVQKHGILKKKIAYDLGARISTENLAWDSQTGGVLVTKTNNEFDNDYYYTLNYPARWYKDYKSMRSASINIDMEGKLTYQGGGEFSFTFSPSLYNQQDNLEKYLIPGDELNLYLTDGNVKKMWVLWAEYGTNNNNELTLTLINKDGKSFSDCNPAMLSDGEQVDFKVIRSGYRNFNQANMAGITTTLNPVYESGVLRSHIPVFNDYDPQNLNNTDKIVNASAITYSDFWPVPREQNLSFLSTTTVNDLLDNDEKYFADKMKEFKINPYRYNIRGEWKAKASYAYVTARHLSEGSAQTYAPNPKEDGYFESYSPFYVLDPGNGTWSINDNKWQKASTVTRYSPYGFELENKDALNRYSSAQYGYDNTLPVAIASNTQYREIAFDGFEDHKAVTEQTIYGVDYTNYGVCNFSVNPYLPPNSQLSVLCDDFLDENLGTVKDYNKQHFNFEDVISDNTSATITEGGHTGNYSVKIAPQSHLTMTKSLQECGDITNESPCELYEEQPLCYQVNDTSSKCINFAITQTRIDPCTVQIDIDAIQDGSLPSYGTIRLETINFSNELQPILLKYANQTKVYAQITNFEHVPIGYDFIISNNPLVNNTHISIIARTTTIGASSQSVTLNFSGTYSGDIQINNISCNNN